MDLNHKTIVMTGASGGIGTQAASLLAQQGCQLVLVGRNEAILNKILGELPGTTGHAHTVVTANLESAEGRSKVLGFADKADCLINLAGVNQLAMFDSMSDEDIMRIIASNLTAPMLLTRDFIPHLLKKPEAAILNVGSTMGSIGIAGSAVYCASKFGWRGFTEALRRELADTKIAVSYVAPRATKTAMNQGAAALLNLELGNRTDAPAVVAEAIVKALESNNSVSRYLGWPEKLFVRINALFPRLVDGPMIKQLPIIRKHAKSTNTAH